MNHNRFWVMEKTKEDSSSFLKKQKLSAVFIGSIWKDSPHAIAKNLEKDGILTGAGKTKWYDTTIRKILQNEKYIGDASYKNLHCRFLSKHRVKNTGEVPQYYVEDHHEAIIPKNIFMLYRKKCSKAKRKTSKNGVKRSYSSTIAFLIL